MIGKEACMRKVTIIACAILMTVVTSSFALGDEDLAVGGKTALYFGNSAEGLPLGGMLLLHLPGFPLMLGIGASNGPAIGMTADYWFAYGPGSGIVGWYIGVGGYMAIDLEPNRVGAGARIPFAVLLWPLDRRNLELFIEVAPAVGIRFVPTAFHWHFQTALGLRYWF